MCVVVESKASRGLFAERTSTIGTENAFKVGPHIAGVERAGHRVIKCNLGEPDCPLPRHIREEVKRQLDNDNTHYCDPQGVLPLRQAIAGSMGSSRGLDITPDRVCVFSGAKPPIGFSQQIYCDPGDEVIYPSPGFPIYESFIEYVGARPVPLHLEEAAGFSFTGADLEPLITDRTKIIILNFPSNPTGGVATREQLKGIADVIRTRAPQHARIYSDEVYENILFDGAAHHSIASQPGMAEKTIIVSGVSKSYSWTGGRVGWAVLPTAEEAALFKNLNINYVSCVPAYNQMGAKLAIESPESGPEIQKMVSAFQERRDFVTSRGAPSTSSPTSAVSARNWGSWLRTGRSRSRSSPRPARPRSFRCSCSSVITLRSWTGGRSGPSAPRAGISCASRSRRAWRTSRRRWAGSPRRLRTRTASPRS
ncbi:MAG: pyridoxal phosphate-dependent aminotransferase [Planctomycetota bacterium]|jgi:aspartate/methionine/tyrosine aminotransferase